MPLADAITFTRASADQRLTKAVDRLVRHLDLPLPDLPDPIRGAHPGLARAERAHDLAVRIEAVVDRLRNPLSD